MKTDKEIIELTLNKINEFKDQLDSLVGSHLAFMIIELLDMEDTRKINRWLGFIHGTLVALTDCTIEELRNMCR